MEITLIMIRETSCTTTLTNKRERLKKKKIIFTFGGVIPLPGHRMAGSVPKRLLVSQFQVNGALEVLDHLLVIQLVIGEHLFYLLKRGERLGGCI